MQGIDCMRLGLSV